MVLETTTVKGKKSIESLAQAIKPAIKTVRPRKLEQHTELNLADNPDKLLRIAVAAYYKAESRGFDPGHELQDWLEAEVEVEQ